MVNKAKKETLILEEITGIELYANDQAALMSGCWKDPDGYLHNYVYSEVEEGSPIETTIRMIYDIFMEDPYAASIFNKYIEKFEDTEDIDFFTLISFIYMMTKGDVVRFDRKAITISRVAMILSEIFINGQLTEYGKVNRVN